METFPKLMFVYLMLRICICLKYSLNANSTALRIKK